jgi:putative FmdB family regulatory protein
MFLGVLTFIDGISRLVQKKQGSAGMPIYEFECDKCKKQFEVVTLSLSEKPNAVCPACKSKKTRKMISQVSKGRYGGNLSGLSTSTDAPASSACASCTSTNCSTCGH